MAVDAVRLDRQHTPEIDRNPPSARPATANGNAVPRRYRPNRCDAGPMKYGTYARFARPEACQFPASSEWNVKILRSVKEVAEVLVRRRKECSYLLNNVEFIPVASLDPLVPEFVDRRSGEREQNR